MRRLAERKIKPDLETIKGVAAAQVKGGLEDEVQIDVDQERLAALGIPIDRIREVVGVSNVNLPGGALRGEDSQFLIRTVNEFDTSTRSATSSSARTRAAHRCACATWPSCAMGAKEREEITRVDGKECVEIALYKEGDANTVTVARRSCASGSTSGSKKLPPGYTARRCSSTSRISSSSRSTRCATPP